MGGRRIHNSPPAMVPCWCYADTVAVANGSLASRYTQKHFPHLIGKPILGPSSKPKGNCSVGDLASWREHAGDPLYNLLNPCCLVSEWTHAQQSLKACQMLSRSSWRKDVLWCLCERRDSIAPSLLVIQRTHFYDHSAT